MTLEQIIRNLKEQLHTKKHELILAKTDLENVKDQARRLRIEYDELAESYSILQRSFKRCILTAEEGFNFHGRIIYYSGEIARQYTDHQLDNIQIEASECIDENDKERIEFHIKEDINNHG